MNKNYLICGFLVLAFGVIQINGVLAQGFIERFWQKNKISIPIINHYDENVKFRSGVIHSTTVYHYTYQLSSSWSTLSIPTNERPFLGNIESISNASGVGTNIFGFFFDYKINDRLNTSLAWANFPMFQDHSMLFSGDHADSYIMHKQSSSGGNKGGNFSLYEIPWNIKLRSDPKYMGSKSSNAYQLYLLGGLKYSTHIGSKKHYSGTSRDGMVIFDPTLYDVPLIMKPSYWSYEVGLGVSFYLLYSRISPEIRFSESIGNLLDRSHPKANIATSPNRFMNAFDRVGLRSIQFSLTIE